MSSENETEDTILRRRTRTTEVDEWVAPPGSTLTGLPPEPDTDDDDDEVD